MTPVNYPFVTLLLAAMPCGCTDETSESNHAASGQVGTTLSDAGDSGNTDDTQLDAAIRTDAAMRNQGDATAVSDPHDAAASPYADLRTCSGNPLDTVRWPCAADAATCDDAIRISQMCALPWGCDEYALAVVAAVEECGPGRQVIVAQGCGRTVIELRVGPGSATRAFYSTSGGLMGIWSATDVVTDPQTCSAFVPKDCLDWEGDSLSNSVDLCTLRDASTDAADAADAH